MAEEARVKRPSPDNADLSDAELAKIELNRGAPSRRYLVNSLLPCLLDGLREVNAVRPDNPVKWLGEYLVEKSKIGNATFNSGVPIGSDPVASRAQENSQVIKPEKVEVPHAPGSMLSAHAQPDPSQSPEHSKKTNAAEPQAHQLQSDFSTSDLSMAGKPEPEDRPLP